MSPALVAQRANTKSSWTLTKLVAYGLNIAAVKTALAANNTNAGGSFIEQGAQQINVREVGLFKTTADIARVPLKAQNGTALTVGDVAQVIQGPKIRLGQIGRTIRREDGKLAGQRRRGGRHSAAAEGR